MKNYEGTSEELEKLGYTRRGNREADGIIVYPETKEYEELPYSEIEFKEGWIDCYDEYDYFMSLASEKYYEPTIRPGIEKFSVVAPYWTDITYEEESWEQDLGEQNKEGDEDYDSLMYHNGWFGLDVNSLEELEELSDYFRKHGFFKQLREVYPETRKERLWSTRDDIEREAGCYLMLYFGDDYNGLRQTLLGLHTIGYLVKYKEGKYI